MKFKKIYKYLLELPAFAEIAAISRAHKSSNYHSINLWMEPQHKVFLNHSKKLFIIQSGPSSVKQQCSIFSLSQEKSIWQMIPHNLTIYAIYLNEPHLAVSLILQCCILECESVPVRTLDVRVIPRTTMSGVIFHSQYTTWIDERPMTLTTVHCSNHFCIF